MDDSLKDLLRIPGVGKVIAKDLYRLGFKSVADLKAQDPEILYVLHNDLKGEVQDICLLYTFRCAVYFAETPIQKQEVEKLKWWHWMDKVKLDSKSKDAEIRKNKTDKLVM
ncbi:MAG: pathogenicity locus [Cytophagaceae bacterium]|jgi:nucleotidyltransferase/DNA polymerase involved in DNA repair|nr:pathogenicity locus [Cytophagaceae bacterium]